MGATLTVTYEEKKAIRKEYGRFLGEKKEHYRKDNDRIFNEFTRLIRVEGATEEGVYAELCERFDCTSRRINNIRSRVTGHLNPKTEVETQALVVAGIQGLHKELQEANDHYLEELEQIEALEHAGEMWYDIEQTATNGTSGKGAIDSTATKRISIQEAKNRIVERRLALPERFVKSVSSLLAKNVVNIDNRGAQLAQMDIGDMDAEEKQLREQLRIRGKEDA